MARGLRHFGSMKFVVCAKTAALVATAAAAFAVVAVLPSGCSREDDDPPPAADDSTSSNSPPVVQLTGDQLNAIKIGPIQTNAFVIQKTGIGTIDFQNNLYSDSALSTSIFPPEPGTLTKMFVELGDQVQKGEPLYALQTAATNLLVRSPMAGQITAVNASPGISVQPGADPAPCAVADVSVKWLLASVPESDLPFYHPGQPVKATVTAWPDRVFEGKVLKVYPDVDPNTHRITIRCRLSDKRNALRAGMLANFTILVHNPINALAIPANGVVREGDGTLTAWITTDHSHFTQRVIKIGLQENDMDQVLDGLQPGELVVTDGAVFLDNMLQAPADD
jgi:multidrug efflux pump subunit AcrA (membrane-fusion protein)